MKLRKGEKYLYELPRGVKLFLPIVSEDKEMEMMMCTFGHIDGMYSYITTPDGSVIHLGASTPMKKVDDHYQIA